jgi:hypothetical protein
MGWRGSYAYGFSREFSLSMSSNIMVEIEGGERFKATLDSGSTATLISMKILKSLGPKYLSRLVPMLNPMEMRLALNTKEKFYVQHQLDLAMCLLLDYNEKQNNVLESEYSSNAESMDMWKGRGSLWCSTKWN